MKKINPIVMSLATCFSIGILFVVGFWFVGCCLPDWKEWMDGHPRTGIWMLGVGSVTFIVLFFTGCFTRR